MGAIPNRGEPAKKEMLESRDLAGRERGAVKEKSGERRGEGGEQITEIREQRGKSGHSSQGRAAKQKRE